MVFSPNYCEVILFREHKISWFDDVDMFVGTWNRGFFNLTHNY